MNSLASEAIGGFLHARQRPANADLVARWSDEIETQVNVAPGDGEPVAGKPATWSDGIIEWHHIRIPKDAATKPHWKDYPLRYPLPLHAEGIGMTGWRWTTRRSCWVGFDFDSITGHAKGIGLPEEELGRVKEAACGLPYVEVRRSTGGGGIHLYVYFAGDGIRTDSHTEHAALARCVLLMMGEKAGFDFASQIDACGHVMWIWHRKMTPENHGLEIIKPAQTCLAESDLPTNWREQIPTLKALRKKKERKERAALIVPRSSVEEDYKATSDFGFMADVGWSRNGTGWRHPNTDKQLSANVVVGSDGTRLFHCFTSSVLSLEKDRTYNAFDLYALVKHGGDKQAARADLAQQGYGRKKISLISCATLASTDYHLTYAMPGHWVEGQPGIIAGDRKAMKTTNVVAMGISFASGKPFLGHIKVARPYRTVICSGESGMATIQSIACRYCDFLGIELEGIEGLSFSEWLPTLDGNEAPGDLASIERLLQEVEPEIVCLDPVYLMLHGDDAGNMFKIGRALRPISDLCREHGVTLIVCHHTKKKDHKRPSDYESPELHDVAWAGFSEWMRQWLFIARRERYAADGMHRLWLDFGGSAGHSARYACDIDEGPAEARYFKATLSTPSEARQTKEAASIRDRLLAAAREVPRGETKSALYALAHIRRDAGVGIVFDNLVAEGLLAPCKVKKENKQEYDGYRLADSQPEVTP